VPVAVILIAVLCSGCASGVWDRGRPSIERHTLKELRDLYVVKQDRDYSCGAAALATLLQYYFRDATSEQELLTLLEGQLTDEEKRNKQRRGFSLLDLKHVAEEKGYEAAGFQLTVSQLSQLVAPVIVFLEPMGYKHFAVYRGMKGDRVYLADPARGNLRMSLGRFEGEWKGIVFVLGKPDEPEEYPLKVPEPRFYVQPEIARFNGQLDLGMLLGALPLR
jgi:predicted double-glycine peptidase